MVIDREALDYARGEREGFVAHVPELIDVKAVRSKMGPSQAKFANQFGLSVDAVPNWEQGRRQMKARTMAIAKGEISPSESSLALTDGIVAEPGGHQSEVHPFGGGRSSRKRLG